MHSDDVEQGVEVGRSCDYESDEKAYDANGDGEAPGDSKQVSHAWSVVVIGQDVDGSATCWGADMSFRDGEGGAVHLKKPVRLQHERTRFLWRVFASWICCSLVARSIARI
mmetsp:Transcript_7040/g.13273  ORF Transcript_7040/g.13273 Transcript_7040/m.13273 type:complete len:111 (-) Transcript_7040:1084-1416(-)